MHTELEATTRPGGYGVRGWGEAICMKVGWAFRLSSEDEMDELIDLPHPFPDCENLISHGGGLASFRAINIRYSLPDASPKRKRHFRLGARIR